MSDRFDVHCASAFAGWLQSLKRTASHFVDAHDRAEWARRVLPRAIKGGNRQTIEWVIGQCGRSRWDPRHVVPHVVELCKRKGAVRVKDVFELWKGVGLDLTSGDEADATLTECLWAAVNNNRLTTAQWLVSVMTRAHIPVRIGFDCFRVAHRASEWRVARWLVSLRFQRGCSIAICRHFDSRRRIAPSPFGLWLTNTLSMDACNLRRMRPFRLVLAVYICALLRRAVRHVGFGALLLRRTMSSHRAAFVSDSMYG